MIRVAAREAAAPAGRQGRQFARARRGLGKAAEPETSEHRGDANIQVPHIGRGHGGEELIVIADESGIVGTRDQSCGDRLEARGHGSQRRGSGIEVVADVAGAGQDVGDGSDGRGPECVGVGNEVTRDKAQESGLAAAVGADEACALPVADGEGDAVEERLRSEGERHGLESDRGTAPSVRRITGYPSDQGARPRDRSSTKTLPAPPDANGNGRRLLRNRPINSYKERTCFGAGSDPAESTDSAVVEDSGSGLADACHSKVRRKSSMAGSR